MAAETVHLYALYHGGRRAFVLSYLLDDTVAATVELGHTLTSGTAEGNMIATIGSFPDSVIIINDRHDHHQQQLVELTHQPVAVAISPAQDTIAVMLINGLSLD